jgi:hypothetical protein
LLGAICSNRESQEERHLATEEAIAYYNKWLMFFTAFLAIATMGLGFATVGLYLISGRQLRHAESEAQRARAYRLKDEPRIEEQIKISRQNAEAAKLSAEAIISADRAHLFVVVVENNVHTAMRSVGRQLSILAVRRRNNGLEIRLRRYDYDSCRRRKFSDSTRHAMCSRIRTQHC